MKAAVLKTVVRQRTVGSNPTSSATIKYAPVPQLDRGADYESDRRGFESLRAHHLNPQTVKKLKQTQLDFLNFKNLALTQLYLLSKTDSHIATSKQTSHLHCKLLKQCTALMHLYPKISDRLRLAIGQVIRPLKHCFLRRVFKTQRV